MLLCPGVARGGDGFGDHISAGAGLFEITVLLTGCFNLIQNIGMAVGMDLGDFVQGIRFGFAADGTGTLCPAFLFGGGFFHGEPVAPGMTGFGDGLCNIFAAGAEVVADAGGGAAGFCQNGGRLVVDMFDIFRIFGFAAVAADSPATGRRVHYPDSAGIVGVIASVVTGNRT